MPPKQLLAVLGGTLLLVAGCGDDDGDDEAGATSTTEGGVEVSEEFCDARVATEAAFVSEDQEAAQAALADLEAAAPEAIQDDVATVVTGLREDPEAAFDDPEFNAARAAVDEAVIGGCGFDVVEVEGRDFAFDGVPDTIDAGTVAFQFTNVAESELHEIFVARINDGVDASAEELLALPEEQAQQNLTPVGGAFAPPGASDTTIAALEPGRYLVLCSIPVGTTEETQGTGPPHFVEGMFAEFTVE